MDAFAFYFGWWPNFSGYPCDPLNYYRDEATAPQLHTRFTPSVLDSSLSIETSTVVVTFKDRHLCGNTTWFLYHTHLLGISTLGKERKTVNLQTGSIIMIIHIYMVITLHHLLRGIFVPPHRRSDQYIRASPQTITLSSIVGFLL